MPLLLILPLIILGVFLLWALLLPISLVQRYRFGKARRRVVPWMASVNAWLVLLSVLSFIFSAWMAGRWLDGALQWAMGGLGVGFLLGLLNVWGSHLEWEGGKLFVTPNPWLALALTLLVAGRIGLGLWQLTQHGFQLHRHVDAATPWFLHPDSLFALGGLLLGHYFASTWSVRARLRRGL